MQLYLDLVSPPCRCVYLFAKTLGIQFEFKLVELSKGQQYSEDFGRLSVVRKVPVLKDGSFVLTESVAILRYLLQKHVADVAGHWYPADLQQRARVDEFLSWQHMNLGTHTAKVFLLTTLFPVVMDTEVPKDKMDAAVEDLKQSLDLLEEKFLQSRAFMLGEKVSVADLVAVVQMMQPMGGGYDAFAGRPKLAAWRERVKRQLGGKLFDEAHEALMKTRDMVEKMKNSSEMQMMRPTLQKFFR